LDADGHPGLIQALYRYFGKPSQGERVTKLYKVFDSVTKVINRGTQADFQLLADRLSEVFAINAPYELPLGLHPDADKVFAFKAFILAKERLVKRDFEHFKDESKFVSQKLNNRFIKKFPDLSVLDYRDALNGIYDENLGEPFIPKVPIVSTVKLTSIIVPVIDVLQRQIDALIHEARTYHRAVVYTRWTRENLSNETISLPRDGPIDDRHLVREGIAKYFISAKVFTMRNSFSLTMSEARLVKQVIDSAREVTSETFYLDLARLNLYTTD
jgi:hypothetical protein